MKKIKVTVLIMLFAFGTKAQESKTKKKIDHRVEKLSETVNLTEAQRVDVYEIFSANALKRKTMNDSSNLTKENIMKLRLERKNELEKVLTQEQIVKLEDHKAALKESRATNRQINKEKIKPILKSKRMEFDSLLNDEEKAIIEEARLLRKGKKSKGVETAEEKVLRKEKNAQIKTMLDPIIISHRDDLDKINNELRPILDEAKEPHLPKISDKRDKQNKFAYRFLMLK